MTNERRPYGRTDFEVALICALQLEFDAVSLVIDEFWDNEGDQYGRAQGDHNTYTTGRIGKHNVVVTLLGMGKTNSTSAAANLRLSYPNVKLAVLVGICGGIPFIGEEQVRLGDVLISKTVFQHDFGTQTKDQFIRKSTPEASLGRPPKNILNLLANIETDHGKNQLRKRATVFFHHLQQTAAQRGRAAKYNSPYTTSLAPGSQVSRTTTLVKYEDQGAIPKEFPVPAIYIGPIASGDTVMRSAEHRDKLVQDEGVIGFEMEGAGAWQELPCIIVKGVCDYADSEKTKTWQDFAAATAAATSKAILERYTLTDKTSAATASKCQEARQLGSSYTARVEAKEDVGQGNKMSITSSQPLRDYVQEGSNFGGSIRTEGGVQQGNTMTFS
ncbi:PNP-UDP-1 domain-containing protein [Fusarium keratoplasticum]|nr:PNP-UDP-1 domain-containing protein [Fusarium keratoplasticum]KAI8649064.1 PNP-UDP-1 domain-containing protein [Fusarium keratoplasticum]